MWTELRRRLDWRARCTAILLAAVATHAAHAEAPAVRLVPPTPAAPASPTIAPDPAFQASKQAFEALSEAERRTVQEALVWTGAYKGALDGNYGKGTHDALLAFETLEKLNGHGIVDAGELARLVAAAKKAKDAVRFTIVTDPATGVRIGLPLRTLTKRSAIPGGTRYASPDGAVSVETQAMPQSGLDLAKLFDRLKTDTADRKVTYKASKPDWFVVSGAASEKRFYMRFAQGPAANGGELRGYTLTYPAAAADLDRISIAIANAFDPFPAPPAQADNIPTPGKPAQSPPTVPATPPLPVVPARPQLSATGLIVAPGRLVSVLPETCPEPSARKQKLRLLIADAASGLALFEVAGARAASPPLNGADVENGASLVIIGFAGGRGASTLGVASGEALLRPAAGAQAAELRVLAPLQQNAGGSAVFDRSGALRGLIGRETQAPRVVAGIVPLASHGVIAAAELTRFLTGAGVATSAVTVAATRTAGDIAAAAASSLVAIDCMR